MVTSRKAILLQQHIGLKAPALKEPILQKNAFLLQTLSTDPSATPLQSKGTRARELKETWAEAFTGKKWNEQ